jgi:hypothetical protein
MSQNRDMGTRQIASKTAVNSVLSSCRNFLSSDENSPVDSGSHPRRQVVVVEFTGDLA